MLLIDMNLRFLKFCIVLTKNCQFLQMKYYIPKQTKVKLWSTIKKYSSKWYKDSTPSLKTLKTQAYPNFVGQLWSKFWPEQSFDLKIWVSKESISLVKRSKFWNVRKI